MKKTDKKVLFDKEFECPNCLHKFNMKQTITSRLRLLTHSADGHYCYTPTSPLYYQTMVCPVCGMAYTKNLNINIKDSEKLKLMDYFTTIKDFQSLVGERTLEDGIRADELALMVAEIAQQPNTLRGAHCLKMSWMYNEKGDLPGEKGYLEKAKSALEVAYETEDFEYIGMKLHVMYNSLAEINRKLDNYEAAGMWYQRLFALEHDKERDIPKVVFSNARKNWEDYANERRSKKK